MTNQHRITCSIFLLAASSSVSPLVRASPPLTLDILSPTSTNGSFALAITGASQAECDAVTGTISIDDGTALTFSPVGACNYAVTPGAPLAEGQHCITLANFTGTTQRTCFEVTGDAADPRVARIVLTAAPPDTWLPSACNPCAGSANLSCTRQQRHRAARLTLEDAAPELASRYSFAALDLSTRGDQPGASDYFLLGVPLSRPLTLLPRASDQQACIAVYALEFGATSSIKVGEQCLDPLLPSTRPAPLLASSCEPQYVARWCADNRADCTSNPSLDACATFEATCANAGDAGPDDAGSSQTPAPVDASIASTSDASTPVLPDSAAVALASDSGGDRERARSSGCAASPRAGGLNASLLLGGLIFGFASRPRGNKKAELSQRRSHAIGRRR